MTQRLQSRGLRVDVRGVDAASDCVPHSYGHVQQFFRQHPCTALYRALLEVRDGPLSVLIAVASVDMPTEAQARLLHQIVDRPGSGNITELTKEGWGRTSVRWTGEHYASVRYDLTVVNAQAEPVGLTRTAAQLAEQAAQTAAS